jgi:hypothetical protein
MAEKEKEEWGETVKVAATDNSDEWGETVAVNSPKSPAPSKTGGESGAYVKPITPSTPTLPSGGSESESWTETAKPVFGGVAANPVKKAKYEPSNFGEILKKANLGVINPDLDEVVNKSKPMNVGGVEVSVKGGEAPPMALNVPKKEVDQDIDLLVKRTNVVRKLRDQEIDKAKQLQLGLEQIKQKGANLNEQYKVNPTPELEAQLNQTVKDLQDTEKAYNRAAFAQDVYEKRILQTSDSIKKLANDKVPQDFFSGFYSGMKDNLESRGKAYDLATMGKAEQIQYAKDQALKAPSIRVGDRVQWVANGEEKFDEPLKIRRISDDGSTAFILVNGVENQIPLEQLEKPTSLMAEGGQMLGGVAPDIAEAIGWSLAGLPFIGAASVAARQGAQQATEDFSRVFNEVKSKGLPTGKKDIKGKDIMREATDDEAYDIAIRAAGMGAATGAAEGLVGTLGGGKLIGALASKARTQGGKIIAEKVLDTASDAAIAGGMQVTRNAFDQYQGIDTKITQGVGETMLGEALLSVPMNTFSGVGEYSKAKKETAVRDVFKAINESKSNPYELQKLQSNLDVLKSQKLISDVDYNELNKKAEDYIRVVETIPTEVSDKQKAADLIIERDELEAKKESVDKAFQKPIDEKINAINDELVVMATPVELKKNTSPTPANYGTINRNDGKGVVNLTQEEFEAEQANMQPKAEGTAPVVEPLKDVESTTKALKEVDLADSNIPLPQLEIDGYKRKASENYKLNDAVSIAEAYHIAKADGSNPELVKAVEELLTPKTTTNEEANEDGEQKRGKDGEEDVPESLQNEGKDGGQKVDVQEGQVLGTEGAVTAAPLKDEKGEPLIVYRSTYSENDLNDGVNYFAEDADYSKKIAAIMNSDGKASDYVEKKEVRTIPVNISAKRVYELPNGIEMNGNVIKGLIKKDPDFTKKYDAVKGIDLYSDNKIVYAVFDKNNIKPLNKQEITNESNIQQPMDKVSSNDGAVGDIAKESDVVKIIDDEYIYHGTKDKNIESIAKEGLKVGTRWHTNGKIFFSPSEKISSIYGNILRIKKSAISDLKKADRSTKVDVGDVFETRIAIKPSDIEIKTESGWKPLQEAPKTEQTPPALKDVESTAKALETELNELGQKQLTKGFNSLSEATKPEQVANAIVNIEQNKNQGARLSKEQEQQLSEAKAKLKEQGYEIIDYNIVRNGENTIVQGVDYYNNEKDVLTEEQANAIEQRINSLEKRGEEVTVDDLPKPISRTIKPLIKKDGKMVQAAEVNTLIFESVEQAREAIKKSREAGYKKPNAADKIKAKYKSESLLSKEQTPPALRDGGTENEGGQESTELRTEEEVEKEQNKETQVLLNGEAEKRRKAGKFIKDTIEYVRNAVSKGVRGNKGEVKFAEGVPSMPFTYKLVEAEEVQPSHTGGIRNQMHFIPEAQPKNRNDEGSKAAEIGFANNPRFNEMGENTNAYSGAPIVNERNEVVQGNNRSAGLKLGYKQGVKKYKADLIANAEKFGFTKEQVEGMKNPILVREVAFNDEGAIEFGNYDVKDLETGGKRRLDPVALVKRIPIKTKAALTKLLFTDEGTLNKSIRENSKKVLELISPFINQAQRNTLLKDGELSASGVQDIEAVVQQFLFDNGDMALPDFFEGLSYKQKEGIRKSLPSIFSAGIDADIIPEIQNAILAVSKFEASGLKSMDNWLNQPDMFLDGKTPRDIYTPQELAIARLLIESKEQAEIIKKFKEFAKAVEGTPDMPATLLDEAIEGTKGQSKEEALKQIFNVQENESKQKDNTGGGKEADSKTPKAEQPKPAKATEKPTEPKNASDVAKIYRNKFGFTPQRSVWAARLFDAKAAFMSKILGISKEDYYSQYWFGVNEGEGGLSQLIEQSKENNISLGGKGKGFLNAEQIKSLTEEIESNYADNVGELLRREKDDIRSKLFNYDEPIASKTINGVDLRIAEGLTRDKKKTYLLYADGGIIGEFDSVADAKSAVKFVEDRLIKNKQLFQESEKNSGFQTRDGKPIGFNYDTDKVARERFDFSNLKKIGSGSDRDVYDLGDGKVLKVAKTARGLNQNIYEGDFYLGIVPKVFERGLNYVVAENTPRIKTSDIVQTFDVDGNEIGTSTAGQMLKELQQFSQKDFDSKVSKLQDVLAKYGLQDVTSYEVLWNDFTAQRNWGYKDGVAYHSDGGTFGGVNMISSYKGKTNMSDPEFREIYQESKKLKKQFGDTDKARMYQERKGSWTKDVAKMKRIINMYEKADSTTAVHEMLGHDYLDRIIEASATNKESEADLRTIAEEYIKDTKSKEKVEDVIKTLKDFDVEKNKTDKGTKVHEWFATQAEQYFATEKDVKRETPQQSKMAKIFEAFRAHLAELYDIMNKTLIAPSEPMKQVFRKVFGEENFNKAEEIRAENVEAINNLNAAALEGNKKAGGLKSLADKLKEKGLGQSEFAQDIWDAASELIANGKAKRYNVTDVMKEMFPAIEGDIEGMRKVLQTIGTKGELRQGAESILANPTISDEIKEKVAKMSEYTPETLKKVGLSTNEVIDYYIGEYGEVAGLEKIKSLLDKGEFDGYTEKVAIQQSLIGMYNKLAKFGATEQIRKEALNNAVDVAEQYINQGTSFGRAINAYKLLGSLTTEGRLVWAKRQTNKYVKPAHEALKENIRELKADLKDAYKQVDYFFEQTLGREETEGQYKEAIAQYQAEIDALKARKPREPKPSKTAYKGVKANREFKESDLANFAKDILAGGLFQDMETMTAPQKLAYGIMEKKPTNISEFAKAFGRYLGKKIDPKELEELYVQTRDLLITKDLAFADGLSTNEQLRADLEGLEVANKVKIEELERKKAEAEAKEAAKAKKGEKKEHSEELADFVIKDAKKAMNGSIAKQKTYLDEILKALKEKTADVINKGKKDKIQTAKVSEVEAIKFALDAINNGGADANMWNDAVEQVKAKIKADNDLSQQDKDDLNLYLNDYTTFLYDNLLSENKIFKVIREKLIQSGYGNGTLVNWKQIIEGANGDVDVMRESIQKLVKNQLKDYDNAQVEKVLDAIVYKYDQEINKQRKKIADKYVEKELSDKKSTKKKTSAVQGKIGKILVENRLGILKDGNEDILNELAVAKGLQMMSAADWKTARQLAENIENSADGILKNRAIEEMTAFIASKQPLSFMNTLSAARFAGLLGRVTTVAVNLISNTIEGGLLAGGRAIRGNTSFIKESFKGVSKGGFKDIFFGGGINQASKTSVEVNSSGMPYFRALEYYEGKGKKFIKSGKYVGRVLDATDSVFQEMFASGYDKVYLEKQIKLENPNATTAEIDQMVSDALSKTKYDAFYAQALQEVIKSGQKPTPANVKRRTYEILRESQVSQMAINLSDLESREKTFKSEFKENRGVATLFGSMLASSSNVSRKVVEPVAEYMFKLSGYNPKQAAELAKKIGDVIPNKIMPFTRGVSNVIEKALEKDIVYGLTKSLVVKLGVNKMPTTTMEEKMAKVRAEEKVKDLATTAIFTNILIYGVGSLLYAASKAWDDDEEKEGRNPEKTGVYPIQSQKTSIGSTSSAKERATPENTLVLFGQKIPLKWLGSIGAELSLTANINKALTKDSKSSGAEKVANAALDISESYMQQSFMMAQNDKQSVVSLLRNENVNWDKVEDYMVNDMISYGGSYVLWSGFVNQSLQGARYLSGDKSYQEAKTISEKLQKQIGLAGITYDNKKPNYMGRPLEATEVNREGIQGFLGMFSKSYKSPTESWVESVGYKESLVSRGSKQLARIESESFVSPSNEQYDDFTDKTRKLIGKGIEFAYGKRNEVVVPLDADGGLEVNKKTGKAYTKDEYTNELLNDMSNAIEGYKRTELVNKLDVNKYDRDEYLSELDKYYYKLEDAMYEFYRKGSLIRDADMKIFNDKVNAILPLPPDK